MLAIDAPIFLDLEIARQWVKEQTLDEQVFLVEFKANGWTGDPLIYEFFGLDEWNEFISTYTGSREVTIIEQWS